MAGQNQVGSGAHGQVQMTSDSHEGATVVACHADSNMQLLDTFSLDRPEKIQF
jgi:hypothetical protein